jgi:ATP-dependent DNA ligase
VTVQAAHRAGNTRPAKSYGLQLREVSGRFAFCFKFLIFENMKFAPCIPTPAATVPIGPDWLHEVKYDGYRLIVHRDGGRVRLFTRNGNDWTSRYPWIVESALRNRATHFVIAARL